MPRYSTTTAIVIKKRKTKEADLLITLLTPYHGKIVALAKNVQNIKSARLGALQLGNTVKVHLYHKNDFTWISEARTISSFLRQPKNLAQLNLLFYFLETVNHLIAENQHINQIFIICQDIISAINQNQVKKYLQNEIKLISLLGFGLPAQIPTYFQKGDYQKTQQHIQKFLESIIEKPLHSPKLFK